MKKPSAGSARVLRPEWYDPTLNPLDRMLHHGHVLKCGPKSWRVKDHAGLHTEDTPR